jgi:hypothetical protein
MPRTLTTRQYSLTNLQAVDQVLRQVAIDITATSHDLDTLFAESGADTATAAPTNTPTPTGLTAILDDDGSMRVTLTWDYSQGTIKADVFAIFWKEGAGPLSAPTTQDKAIGVLASARSFTFLGLNPGVNYRFGIAAARRASATSSTVAGTIQSPTASPDWSDINGTGNYTGLLAGAPANTVVANAADGKTAFNDTVNYRSAGAPTNTPTPAGLTSTLMTDGSVDYSIFWNYTQGAKKADGFFAFVKDGDGAPVLADPHFQLGAQTSGTFTTKLTLKGYPSDKTISFGVAAFRRTDNAIEMGAIQSTTSSPDWQGINSGTPNYLGIIVGMKQHNITAMAEGANAGNNGMASVDVDGVNVYFATGFLSRSWHLVELNQDGQVVFSDVFDVWKHNAEVINFRNAYSQRSAANVLLAIGAYEPQNRRLNQETYARLTRAGGTTYGFQQLISGLTGGATYTLSAWIYVFSWSAGTLHLDVAGTGIDTNGIQLTAANSEFTFFSETFVLPGGTTSVNLRFFGGQNANFVAFVTDVYLVAGSTAESGANLVSNFDFQDGMTGWAPLNAPNPGDSFAALANDPDTGLWGVLGCLKDMGGSATLLKSAAFKVGSAYILAGKKGIGEGNGIEVYKGKTNNETTAAAALTVQSQSGRLIALGGKGWTPHVIPGAPTNTPTPTGLTNTATVSVRLHKLTWSYTQAEMEGENRLADGFVIFYQIGDTSNPTGQQVKVDVGAADYTFTWNHMPGTGVSYAIAAYRKTSSGIEVGQKKSIAAWRNVSADLYVQSLEPGPPTNTPTSLALTNTAVATGERTHKLTWSYTQGALAADGFILYYQAVNTTNPVEQQVAIGNDVRAYTFQWSLAAGAVVSYGIAAYRRTVNGVEIGTKQTVASWQNVAADKTVDTNGMTNNAVTTAKRQDVSMQSAQSGTILKNSGSNPVTNRFTVVSFAHGLSKTPTALARTNGSAFPATVSLIDATNINVQCVNLYVNDQDATVSVYYW